MKRFNINYAINKLASDSRFWKMTIGVIFVAILLVK